MRHSAEARLDPRLRGDDEMKGMGQYSSCVGGGPFIKGCLPPPRAGNKNGMTERFGALAQLGERYNGIVEVSGSIPLGSTILPSFGPDRAAYGGILRFRCSRT